MLEGLTFMEYLDYMSENESSYADKEFIKNSLLLISHHGHDGRGILDEKDETAYFG